MKLRISKMLLIQNELFLTKFNEKLTKAYLKFIAFKINSMKILALFQYY